MKRMQRSISMINKNSDTASCNDVDKIKSRRAASSEVNNEKNTCMVHLVSDHTFNAYQGGQTQSIAAMENILTQVLYIGR